MFDAVLLDLDGTFADTAPDLGAALNRLLHEDGLAERPLDELRPHTSAGTRGMLRAGYRIAPDHDTYPALAARFLAHYADTLCADTRLFPGMAEFIDALRHADIPWGIVTNKPKRFTEPLMAALPLGHTAATIISGDSTPSPKPAPDALLLACRMINCPPSRTLYVGDDLRDIQAGRAAGMPTAAAAWGYLGIDHPIDTWGADWIIAAPEGLIPLCRGES